LCNSSGMSNTEIVKAVDIALNKLPLADENYFKIRKKANELAEIEQQLRHDNEVLKNKSFSLTKEISDLEVEKFELIEYCNGIKEELKELREEQQQIQNTMNKYQHVVLCNFAAALYIVLDTIATNLVRAIEIQEMHKGDIAE
jgi:predicted nuclease with TOPRIM domain